MSDVKRWTIFSLVDNGMIESIRFALVFGSSANEALIVTADDQVFGIGSNGNGCLGLGSISCCLEPHRIDGICNRGVIYIAYGSGPHIVALTNQGEVYTWGHNGFGQLGIGGGNICNVPTLVTTNLANHRVTQVACGSHHSLALTDKGTLFSWGQNSNGQLGIGNTTNQTLPKKVGGILDHSFVTSVTCGQNSSFATSSSGKVFSWGFNGNGQLGIGSTVNQSVPCRLDELDAQTINHIHAGFAHCMAVTDHGELYAWGSNSCGQLGTANRSNQLVPVQTAASLGRVLEAAAIHSCNLSAVLAQGQKVYMWGQCRGQAVLEPLLTRFPTIDDVFACFANPAVCWRPLNFAPISRNSVQDGIRGAFDDSSTADLAFKIDERFIHVHKAILKIRCQYFRSMFQEGKWREGEKEIIEVNHYSYPVYRAFLSYLYTGRVNLCPEDAIGLLDLANSYCEVELKEKCTELIRHGITKENAALLYAAGCRFGAEDLEEFCFRFSLCHMSSVVQSEAFQRMDNGMMKRFILQAAKAGAFKS